MYKLKLCYYRDSMTNILNASTLFKHKLCRGSQGTDCHAESPAARVWCFKMATIVPV